MQFINFLIALSPIIVVLVGILAFKQSAKRVAPIALVWTVLLALTYFNVQGLTFQENVAAMDAQLWKGIKEGFKIVVMVFGAFVILNTLKKTGAIEDVKNTIARLSGEDRRVQLIIIGFMVPIFLEGAAGAGAPAAIAAPFLVALGFEPITAIAVALMGDATPCSWGGAGLTTINGGAALVEAGVSTNALNSAMVGRFHMFGAMVIPFLIIALAFGRKAFKGIVPYLTYAGVTTGIMYFLLSNFVGPEVTSMGTGLSAIVLSVLYVKFIPIKTTEEYRYHAPEKVEHKYGPFQALSPYIYMLILLPLIRYGVPALWPERGFATLCTFGYISWVDAVILLCGILGAITLHVRWRDLHAIFGETIKSVMPVMITMGSLLVMAYIMQSQTTGMMSLIAGSIAGVAKSAYPAAAVIIGSLGSFITGTGLGSNIMFAGMHMEAAGALGMNPVTVFAGQNAAASLGNLICPNNTVAACATVGEIGHENLVMKKTLVAFAVLIVLYMVLAMLYSLVLFPNFGM
ncbi:MAG: L-lactate permease [Oscillibacter sp.]|nr:L-lactate permease [Oscillibacter sp.]MBR1690545.1 L-lactate permease [Oscillibacter sp.]